MHTLAQQFGAIVVSLEHRYYGKSWPTTDMSTANLKSYLSSAQALADLANFQHWFAHNSNTYFPPHPLTSSDWVAFGGSYPGNLAAWLKVKYPHAFKGTIASSAPLLAKENWPGYMQVVSESLQHFGSNKCFNAVQQSVNTIMQYVDNSEWSKLNALYTTCAPGLSSGSKTNGDLSTFLSNVQTFFQSLVQYNRDRLNAPTVATVCQTLLNDTSNTFQAFVNLTQFQSPQNCTEISTIDVYKALNNVTLTGGSSSAMRPWTFQTCNEFGYFQTVGTDSQLDAFSAMSNYVNLKSFTDICDQVFEFDGAAPRIAWSNTQYGTPASIAAVNVTFPSGSLDPWHVLGVTNTTHPWKAEKVVASELAVEIPFTSHCQDMYAKDFGLPEIEWAHGVIQSRVGHYLSSYVTPPVPAPPAPAPAPAPASLSPSSSSGSGGGGGGGGSGLRCQMCGTSMVEPLAAGGCENGGGRGGDHRRGEGKGGSEKVEGEKPCRGCVWRKSYRRMKGLIMASAREMEETG